MLVVFPLRCIRGGQLHNTAIVEARGLNAELPVLCLNLTHYIVNSVLYFLLETGMHQHLSLQVSFFFIKPFACIVQGLYFLVFTVINGLICYNFTLLKQFPLLLVT